MVIFITSMLLNFRRTFNRATRSGLQNTNGHQMAANHQSFQSLYCHLMVIPSFTICQHQNIETGLLFIFNTDNCLIQMTVLHIILDVFKEKEVMPEVILTARLTVTLMVPQYLEIISKNDNLSTMKGIKSWRLLQKMPRKNQFHPMSGLSL